MSESVIKESRSQILNQQNIASSLSEMSQSEIYSCTSERIQQPSIILPGLIIQENQIKKISIMPYLIQVKQFLINNSKVSLYGLINFIQYQAKWRSAQIPPSYISTQQQTQQIQVIKQLITKITEQLIPVKEGSDKVQDEIRMGQFFLYLELLNNLSTNYMFNLFTECFINESSLTKLVDLIRNFHSLKTIKNKKTEVCGFTKEIYKNQKILNCFFNISEEYQSKGILKDFWNNLVNKSNQFILFGLNKDEFIEIFLKVAKQVQIPHGFVQRLNKYLLLELKGYKQLIELILQYLDNQNASQTHLEDIFVYIYQNATKFDKFKPVPEDFEKGLIFTNLWISISKLSSYSNFFNKFQETILKLIFSNAQMDKQICKKLFQNFKTNIKGFNDKIVDKNESIWGKTDRQKMIRRIGTMFEVEFQDIKNQQIQKILRAFLSSQKSLQQFINLKNSNILKEQINACIIAENPIIKKEYQKLIDDIKTGKITFQALKSFYSKLKDFFIQGPLKIYERQLNQIYKLSIEGITSFSQIKNFLIEYKKIHIYFLQKSKQLLGQNILPTVQFIQINKIKVEETLKMLNEKEILLKEINQSMEQKGMTAALKNIIVLSCFYQTQAFVAVLTKSKGKILMEPNKYKYFIQTEVWQKIQQQNLDFIQVNRIFRKAHPQRLQKYLQVQLNNNTISRSWAKVFVQFNNIKPFIDFISEFIKKALFFKTQILGQHVQLQLRNKLIELSKTYDAQIKQSRINAISISTVDYMCKVYKKINQIFQYLKMDFIFNHISKINCYFDSYKMLLRLIFGLNSVEKITVKTITKEKIEQLETNNMESQTILKFQTFLNVLQKLSQIKRTLNPFQSFITQNSVSDEQLKICKSIELKIIQIVKQAKQKLKNKLIKLIKQDVLFENLQKQNQVFQNKNEQQHLISRYGIVQIKQKKIKQQQISRIFEPQHEQILNKSNQQPGNKIFNNSAIYPDITTSSQVQDKPLQEVQKRQSPQVMTFLKNIKIIYSPNVPSSSLQTQVISNQLDNQNLDHLILKEQIYSQQFLIESFKNFYWQNFIQTAGEQQSLFYSNDSNFSTFQQITQKRLKTQLEQTFPNLLAPSTNQQGFLLFFYAILKLLLIELINENDQLCFSSLGSVSQELRIEVNMVFQRNFIIDRLFKTVKDQLLQSDYSFNNSHQINKQINHQSNQNHYSIKSIINYNPQITNIQFPEPQNNQQYILRFKVQKR